MEGKQPLVRSRQVTEMFTWLQFLSTYVSVLFSSSPESVPDLIAILLVWLRCVTMLHFGV